MTEKKRTLIDKLLDNAKEVTKVFKRDTVKRRIRKSLESAIDGTYEDRDKAEMKIVSLREEMITSELDKIESILNQILKQRETIIKAKRTEEAAQIEYKELFGKEYVYKIED